MHWSYGQKAWLGFVASLSNGHALLRHELTWKGVPPERAALDIRRALVQWAIEDLNYVAAQPGIFPVEKSRGETVSETFIRAGIPLLQGDGDELNGFSRVRSWLEVQDDGLPGLLVHPDCKHFLRTFPTIIENSTKPDHIEDTPDANPARGLAYYCMSRPMPSRADATPEPPPESFYWTLEKLRRPSRPMVGDNLVSR